MRLIDLDDDSHCFTGNCGDYENWNIDPDIPTVDAIPVSYIQQRIDHLQDVADYALDSIGGYIESANSSLYELKLVLSMWENEKRKQNAD